MFEKGLKENDPDISPSMIYAYAAIRLGIPYVSGAPNTSVEISALAETARARVVPIAGKDFKTGQTLMKTIGCLGCAAGSPPTCEAERDAGVAFVLFQSPDGAARSRPMHDLFVQHFKLTNTLRILAGEEVLHHSGLDYYEEAA